MHIVLGLICNLLEHVDHEFGTCRSWQGAICVRFYDTRNINIVHNSNSFKKKKKKRNGPFVYCVYEFNIVDFDTIRKMLRKSSNRLTLSPFDLHIFTFMLFGVVLNRNERIPSIGSMFTRAHHTRNVSNNVTIEIPTAKKWRRNNIILKICWIVCVSLFVHNVHYYH